MPTTPILGITQVTASQNNKEVTINDALEALESAANAKLSVSFASSSTVTLSNSQITGNFLFEAVNATGACILQIPTSINSNDTNRIIAVRNNSGHGLTVRFVGNPGESVTIPDGETRLLAAVDGEDVYVAAEPATTVTFVSLTDTPSSFTGQQGKFLSVNVAENELVFADAATFPSFTNNEGKYLVVNSAENGVEWVDLSVVTAFLDLTDSPSSFSGQAGKLVAVNEDEDGVEFIDVPEAEAVEFVAAQRWRINAQTLGAADQQGFGEVEWLDVDGVVLSTGGTASASNEETGNEAANAFDGVTTAGTGWLTEDTYTGDVWLEYDFGSPVIPRSVRIFPVNNFPDFSPTRFLIEYWNGAAWVNAGDRTAQPWDNTASQTFKVNGQPLTSVAEAPNNGSAYVRKSTDWAIPSIDDLSDVDTSSTTPTDGQALIWDNANSVWVPGDVAAGGGGVFKVRAASTGNVTLSSDVADGDTLDGVTLATGDRILLKNQTDQSENGVYVVAASGAPTRAEDADEGSELVNYACFVSEGTDNADRFFQCTTNSPITVDTTNLTFAEVAGGGGENAVAESVVVSAADTNLENSQSTQYIRFTNANAKTYTVRPDATHGVDTDAEFHLHNEGTSDLTIVAGSGVTINPPTGGTLVIPSGGTATLKRVAVDSYRLFGGTTTTTAPVSAFTELSDTPSDYTGHEDKLLAVNSAGDALVFVNRQAAPFKVRAASTANVTLATGVENGDTLDGVTLATGDRILLKDQTAGAENGIYVVQASGAPVRAAEANTSSELVNYACFVSEGTVNADKFFQCTTNAPITVGTTALTFTEVAGAGGGGGDVAVEDDGTEILAAASRLNFTGAGVTVTNNGSGEAEVNIPGGGGGGGGGTGVTRTEGSNTGASVSVPVSGEPDRFTLNFKITPSGNNAHNVSFKLNNSGTFRQLRSALFSAAGSTGFSNDTSDSFALTQRASGNSTGSIQFVSIDFWRRADGTVAYRGTHSNIEGDTTDDIAFTHFIGECTGLTGPVTSIDLESSFGEALTSGALEWELWTYSGTVEASHEVVYHGARGSFTDNSSATTDAFVAMSMDAENFDTDGFIDLATNATRITIPSGVSKIRLRALVRKSGNPVPTNDQWRLYKNGSALPLSDGDASVELLEDGYNNSGVNLVSGVIDVVPGDYFELHYFQATANVEYDGWFEVEVVEGAILNHKASSQTITESGTSANLLNVNRGKYQRWTNTSAKTLTVQPNATEAITQDAEFHIRNAAASNLTISAGTGVTINPPAGGTLVLEPQMAVTLKRVAEDEFDLIGQTVAA